MRPDENHLDEVEQFHVVVNHEEQYSIWPSWKEPLPNGWRIVGYTGSKESCLEHINKVWTDMRPLSLRKQMQEAQHLQDSDQQARPL